MTAADPHVCGLLVSVRSASEALAALGGGATLIDVKEPDNGSLGRAADRVIAEVVAAVAGRCPVSAALGELIDDGGDALPSGLAFVKWGLAGHGPGTWRARLDARRGFGAEVVAVAYADWQCARAPAIDDVFAFAARRPGSVLLLDTHCKEPARRGAPRPTLLDWMRPKQVAELRERCRDAKMRIALAGSLGLAELGELAPMRPDWFAVRGAACEGGRQGIVKAAKVRELVHIIARASGQWPRRMSDG
jgi:(5-formylfuran-3-yl)methyl phosphate synthase